MAFKQSLLLRARIAFLAVFLFAAAIVGKLFYIQLVQGTYWKKAAEVARLEYRPIKATRGNIYGSNGSLLATSLPFYRVVLDPCIVDDTTFQKDIDKLSKRLAGFYQDRSAESYQKSIRKARQAKRRYLVLSKRQISYQDRKQMEQWPIFCLGRFRGGVIFDKVEKRFQPFLGLAARTVGYINANEYGAGLEYSFNPSLKGTDGKALHQKIVGGKWKMLYDGSVAQPVHGYDLETTIDINLQDTVHNSLLKVLQASQAAYGCAIVMEVKTGEIKAIVNLSRTGEGQYQERYNYAIGSHGTTEPGSTIKLASMLALLEETKLQLTDTIDTGNGRYRFHDRILTDVRSEGYGELTLQEVFEKSSNIGVARLVDEKFGTGPQKFIDHLSKLHLDKPLGLKMVGAGKPLIRNPQSPQWDGITLPWMSIGYALKVTPMHILTLYNAVANNGKMVQPIIVKKIKQANRTLKTFRGAVLNKKICSKPTLAKLKTLLEGV
ncbi:MAG: penicillin-binding protein 2, partial [Bacteroidota bacterium]